MTAALLFSALIFAAVGLGTLLQGALRRDYEMVGAGVFVALFSLLVGIVALIGVFS